MPNSKTSTLGKAFTINSEKENFDFLYSNKSIATIICMKNKINV